MFLHMGFTQTTMSTNHGSCIFVLKDGGEVNDHATPNCMALV